MGDEDTSFHDGFVEEQVRGDFKNFEEGKKEMEGEF